MHILKHLFIFSLTLTHVAMAQPNSSSAYTEEKQGIIVVSNHPVFTIKLKSNPTTGYSWFLREYNSELLKPIKHTYFPPNNKKLLGAPGYEEWQFTMKNEAFVVPQQTVMRFVYAKPWEGSNQSKQLAFRVSTTSVLSEDHSETTK